MNEFRKLVESVSEVISEGKEEGLVIRKALKDKFGLTSRDVSVKSDWSSVRVKIKTLKALVHESEIEKIGQSQEHYRRDERTGEILQGGNTFVFVDVDSKFQTQLLSKIEKDFNTATKGKDLEPGESVTLYKDISVFIPAKYSKEMGAEHKSSGIAYLPRHRTTPAGLIFALMSKVSEETGDSSIYNKLK